jgi:hypothetical protein
MAELIRPRLMQNLDAVARLKTHLSSNVKIVCRICDTTSPTKEGLLWNDKIVSNLPEQIRATAIGINAFHQYGARPSRLALSCVDRI